MVVLTPPTKKTIKHKLVVLTPPTKKTIKYKMVVPQPPTKKTIKTQSYKKKAIGDVVKSTEGTTLFLFCWLISEGSKVRRCH